jgi:hypothetical protein
VKNWVSGTVIALIAVVLTASASASTLDVTFEGVSGSNPTLTITSGLGTVTGYISPYEGQINGQNVLLYCVDPNQDAPADGKSWWVNVATPGNLSSMDTTYQYLSAKYPAGNSSDETTIDTRYEEMAALVLQMNNPSNTKVTDQELQAAIWTLADPTIGFSNLPSGFSLSQVSADITNAEKNPLTSDFEVLTDTNDKYQEFIVLTPEPSTLITMATGLLALLYMLYRRKHCQLV